MWDRVISLWDRTQNAYIEFSLIKSIERRHFEFIWCKLNAHACQPCCPSFLAMRNAQRKPRAIVVKFNYFRDREFIRQNARKLRGTRIGIAEQFPEEIEKIRQTLYPGMKKAKVAKQRVYVWSETNYLLTVLSSNLKRIKTNIFNTI